MKYLILFFYLSVIFPNTLKAQFDDRFYFPVKEWDEMKLSNYEEILLKKDSVQLSGIFLKTNGVPKATVLYFHGAGGNVTKYYELIKPLAENGYQVLMIDFQGYGKSTGTPTHLNIAEDAQYVFNYLINREDVKNTGIIIYGASMGTQAAAKIARDNQDKISALILDGTISSLMDIALMYCSEKEKQLMQYLVFPYSAKEDIKYIENIPKLFVHSEEDDEVPISQGKIVYENAKEPKTFWTFKGPHLQAMILHKEEFLEKIYKLIKK
jgi:pimeloyl-ACP methyl ester carboxylesterase